MLNRFQQIYALEGPHGAAHSRQGGTKANDFCNIGAANLMTESNILTVIRPVLITTPPKYLILGNPINEQEICKGNWFLLYVKLMASHF